MGKRKIFLYRNTLVWILLGIASCNIPESETPVLEEKDPLPSWNDTKTKNEIVEFVNTVTDEHHPDFIPKENRIATFDNDGTLWAEQPMYFQLLFAIDRIKSLAPDNPDWINEQPFKAVLENDMKSVVASGKQGLVKLIMTTHAGNTTEEFEQIVLEWIENARHPSTGQRYTEMVYLPMLELLDYLRSNDFKTYIVSGGGIEFMRPWVEEVYGIPSEQVIGSSIKTEFVDDNGEYKIRRLPEIDFIDDKAGKPVAINKFIGKKPVIAVGNSDGDLQMLQWTSSGPGKRLMIFVHHTDSTREWNYDKDSEIGKLDVGLDFAQREGWTLVDMAGDWKSIFAYSEK